MELLRAAPEAVISLQLSVNYCNLIICCFHRSFVDGNFALSVRLRRGYWERMVGQILPEVALLLGPSNVGSSLLPLHRDTPRVR